MLWVDQKGNKSKSTTKKWRKNIHWACCFWYLIPVWHVWILIKEILNLHTGTAYETKKMKKKYTLTLLFLIPDFSLKSLNSNYRDWISIRYKRTHETYLIQYFFHSCYNNLWHSTRQIQMCGRINYILNGQKSRTIFYAERIVFRGICDCPRTLVRW